MTELEKFNEWYITTDTRFRNTRDVAFSAWNAAIKNEREACAKVAEKAARKWGDLARRHEKDGNNKNADRCYASSLQCIQVAANIRTCNV